MTTFQTPIDRPAHHGDARRRIPAASPSWSASAERDARACSTGWPKRSAPQGAQYINVERTATTPERFLAALTASSPFVDAGQAPRVVSPREAFDAVLAFFAGARRADEGPVTFLLDEVLEFRTFESFPGLRRALPELLAVIAASPNRFVLTSRYQTRTERALAGASPQFVVVPMPALPADRAVADAGGRGRRGRARRRGGRRIRHGRPQSAGRGRVRRPTVVRAGHRRRDGPELVRGRGPGPDGHARVSARAGGEPVVAVRVRLRDAAPPRARLWRAQGDPRDSLGAGAADAHRRLAAHGPHARIDEGLPVVAGGRGPGGRPPEALSLPRPAAAAVGQAPLPLDAAHWRDSSIARSGSSPSAASRQSRDPGDSRSMAFRAASCSAAFLLGPRADPIASPWTRTST